MSGIVDGEVELQGSHGIIAKLSADVFGEMALVDASPRMATAVATNDTVLAVIDRRLFLFLIHETPTFALQVMAAMADRLRWPTDFALRPDIEREERQEEPSGRAR